jgi:GTPase SAR1 family protein
MLYKLTVLGEGGVGKTALTVQVSSKSPLGDPERRQRADDAVHNVFIRGGTSRSFSKPLQGDFLSLFGCRRNGQPQRWV